MVLPAHIGEPLRFLKSARGRDVATACEGRVQTGAEFVDRIAGLSIGLRRLGLQPGDRACIAALNSEWYLEWLLAVPSAGCIIAPLNHRWSVEEASEAIREVGASLLVVDHQCVGWCPALLRLCPSLKWLVRLGSGGPQINSFLIDAESIIKLAGPKPELELACSPDSIALICFTSGTTGRPKGVSLSHTALNVQSRAKITEVGYSSNDTYLHVATLCHIGGISSALSIVMVGGCHILLPKFEIQAAFRSIEEHNVTAMIVVPSLVSDMASYHYNSARNPSEFVRPRTFSSMRTVLNGAGSLSQDQLKAMQDIFPSAKIMSAYGMTEACSSMTFLLIHDPQKSAPESYNNLTSFNRTPKSSESWHTFHKGGVCVGKPAPHVEIQILTRKPESYLPGIIAKNFTSMEIKGPDSKSSSRLPGFWDSTRKMLFALGGSKQSQSLIRDRALSSEEELVVGNVLTRGAHVMEGYWGRPDKTREALHADGWLDTGDVGWMDEAGRLWLLGRQKDVIKSGGENVYASEVERLLVKHPAVSSAAVVGVPDHRLGEAVTAMVRLKPDWVWCDGRMEAEDAMTAKQRTGEKLLRSYCQQQGLSRYKVPKFILMQEEAFPVTTTGKVKKDEVRDMALAQLSSRQPTEKSMALKHSVAGEGKFIRSRL
ncbi:hypothetical protein Mp_6g06040 [Marchantia polymorpha subsp. ruderalis]|uniref:AMP-dependent synthetase/ligase domain-containing protein n=2 Tax=Marchantia polymorpha TaxID=3197 RepID=A0AAF6BP22_MARPO|nr:hypothetical protein MARPO_0097s0040 [Marchantia polymorpha]PTQ32558.1 hypothetical protein MARPO_0097s0040 [Marchantia polymorpha]BBN13756.1 hypothetical protein Mp_6g06040 [Marchantia polymorpha subsp. ruderalis]BBN13757.1 hypothetical protein Mp_6g06040 [Marchantia polymorpha subsp. ruderalis]|eukprot:PTQ32556.1 hypothetical protein MARPO_0097s0040 [Marchantia polymorpha]